MLADRRFPASPPGYRCDRRVLEMKKIEVRKTGDVRLTSVANPLYTSTNAVVHASTIVICF